jgi:hypothetical protein
LDNESALIETTDPKVEDVVTGLEALDCLLISVKHHQAASNIVLKNGVFDGLDT